MFLSSSPILWDIPLQLHNNHVFWPINGCSHFPSKNFKLITASEMSGFVIKLLFWTTEAVWRCSSVDSEFMFFKMNTCLIVKIKSRLWWIASHVQACYWVYVHHCTHTLYRYKYWHPRVWVCVSAKCHINRLIAVVSDSVTLWLVDSSLIHIPSWVIGTAHWFLACKPIQEEFRGRKRACCYWLAPDQPHHLTVKHTPIHAHKTATITTIRQLLVTFLWLCPCCLQRLP